MPTTLSDLDLDEVSLVGKAANGKKFLIFKSLNKGDRMKQTKPARATRAGAGASVVSKADILSIVEKAVEPIRKENEELRAQLKKKDYVDIAKSHLSEIGTPEEGAEILKSLEGLSKEARDPILKALKQANALKKEAGKVLYNPFGSNKPVPGSATAQLEDLVQKKLGEIRKSGEGAGKSEKVLHSLAVAAITKSNPQLARAVIAEERQNVVKMSMGVQ